MTKYIIYLEGNISSGKSTLLPKLSHKLKTLLSNTNIYEYVEPLHIWNDIKKCDKPILQLLYEHPHQFAPTFQYLTLITRQSQYIEFLEKEGECIALIERSYLSDKLFQNVMFSEGYINKLDMDIYALAQKPKIKHIHIYVRTNPDICYHRIHTTRKRPEEQNINQMYIEKLHRLHEECFFNDQMICVDNNNELTEENITVLCNYIIQMITCS
jgi:deoxyadenosine/deoxycytidine kinase